MNISERIATGVYCMTDNKRIEVKIIWAKGLSFDHKYEVTVTRTDLETDNVVIHYHEKISTVLSVMKAYKNLTAWKNIVPSTEKKKKNKKNEKKEIMNELTSIIY